MAGEITIDTLDIWTNFGAFILAESYNGLMQPAKRKASLSNNWPEESGLEIDLSVPKYEAKDVDVVFILSAASESSWWTRYTAFFALLKSAGERSLYLKELNKTFMVYYKEVTGWEQLTKIKNVPKVAGRFTVKFGIANPAV